MVGEVVVYEQVGGGGAGEGAVGEGGDGEGLAVAEADCAVGFVDGVAVLLVVDGVGYAGELSIGLPIRMAVVGLRSVKVPVGLVIALHGLLLHRVEQAGEVDGMGDLGVGRLDEPRLEGVVLHGFDDGVDDGQTAGLVEGHVQLAGMGCTAGNPVGAGRDGAWVRRRGASAGQAG